MHLMQLSEKLTLILSRKNLTQDQLGAAIGINQTTVGRWLKNETKPYPRIARQLAEYLGITYKELTDENTPLPAQVFGEGIKKAADKATAVFPKNQDAAQAFFELNLAEMHTRESILTFALEIRNRAKELVALADKMEEPYLKKKRPPKY